MPECLIFFQNENSFVSIGFSKIVSEGVFSKRNSFHSQENLMNSAPMNQRGENKTALSVKTARALFNTPQIRFSTPFHSVSPSPHPSPLRSPFCISSPHDANVEVIHASLGRQSLATLMDSSAAEEEKESNKTPRENLLRPHVFQIPLLFCSSEMNATAAPISEETRSVTDGSFKEGFCGNSISHHSGSMPSSRMTTKPHSHIGGTAHFFNTTFTVGSKHPHDVACATERVYRKIPV
ncbi:hypothetical protein CEXT_645841 [Caerostris extrusa]|uniref:Uncharacterized protein n=1 Tax=Caerostris extrusa TaxID=172846 RepID=A0AAV4MEF4_CAEEX|nr:hypothetical protein CEXT_645841 [Caerostris extrusa]